MQKPPYSLKIWYVWPQSPIFCECNISQMQWQNHVKLYFQQPKHQVCARARACRIPIMFTVVWFWSKFRSTFDPNGMLQMQMFALNKYFSFRDFLTFFKCKLSVSLYACPQIIVVVFTHTQYNRMHSSLHTILQAPISITHFNCNVFEQH